MAENIKAPRGTKDVLPDESYKWQLIERVVTETAGVYGFSEIRFPTFEHTELFTRGVGDTTDVVQKEMYTFEDKGNRSITLRPEGTAGAVRLAIENGLCAESLPIKVNYLVSCFRYEKPQAGRLREFHQFGAEMFGTKSPSADAELISLAVDIFNRLGVKDFTTEINSIGCPECRKKYHEALINYFKGYSDKLCGTCLERLNKNPMRILDCKSEICSEISKNAPHVIDYLCDECSEHFDQVKKCLDAMDIKYTVNPTIVRGLDYYTKTVFEFVCNTGDNSGVIGGGGRYDGLFEELGTNPCPALGFAMGLERILMVLEKQGVDLGEKRIPDIYLAPLGDTAKLYCSSLAYKLRKEGFYAITDLMDRSVKAQMKYANKIGAALCVVIGDNEISEGKVSVKNMKDGSCYALDLNDEFISSIYEILSADVLSNLSF